MVTAHDRMVFASLREDIIAHILILRRRRGLQSEFKSHVLAQILAAKFGKRAKDMRWFIQNILTADERAEFRIFPDGATEVEMKEVDRTIDRKPSTRTEPKVVIESTPDRASLSTPLLHTATQERDRVRQASSSPNHEKPVSVRSRPDIPASVRRAIRALKGVRDVTEDSVIERASMYCNETKQEVREYVKNIPFADRITMGFDTDTQPPKTGLQTRPVSPGMIVKKDF